jgi:hypothetical protein
MGLDIRREFYILYSQDHPELSMAEVSIITGGTRDPVSVIHIEPGLVITRTKDLSGFAGYSASYIKEAGEVLLRSHVYEGFHIYRKIKRLGSIMKHCGKIDLRIYNLGRRRVNIDYPLFIRELRRIVGNRGAKEDLVICPITVIFGDIIVIGRPVIRRKILRSEASRERGYMGEEDLGFIANTALYLGNRGGVFYDPFCGYGGILARIYERSQDLVVIGSDIDVRKVYSLRRAIAIKSDRCCLEVIVANALWPPLRMASVSTIASDLPYGRRSRVVGEEILKIPASFLRRAREILAEGSIVVLAISLDQLEPLINEIQREPGYNIVEIASQYVHGSLTRVYLVLRYSYKEKINKI